MVSIFISAFPPRDKNPSYTVELRLPGNLPKSVGPSPNRGLHCMRNGL